MGIVSEEVNLLELLVSDVLQAEGLVPPIGKDVKGDLAAYREREAVVGELLSKHLHEGCTDTVLLGLRLVFCMMRDERNPKYVVVGLELFAFLISTWI